MTPSNIVNSPEEYERFVQEVLIPRYDAMKADPTRGMTHEDMRAALEEWDREDGLLPEDNAEPVQRRA